MSITVPHLSKVVLMTTGGVVVLAAAGVSAAMVVGSGDTHPASVSVQVPRAVVAVTHVRHGRVGWDTPLTIAARHGTISKVVLADSAGQAVTVQAVSPTRWRTTATRLVPSTRYVATVTVADIAGHTRTVTKHVTTRAAAAYLTGLMSPDAKTVGVGEPVSIHFSAPVPDNEQAAVQRRLAVTATPATTGAWHWFDAQDVHWRPKSYWKPGTHVRVHEDFSRLYLGHGMWGATGAHEASFRIGDALISKVNVPDHFMKVYDDGHLVRTMPISAGSPEWPTMGGVHVTLAKTPTIDMDSATVGIPQGSPNYYNETVLWDVRISDGGAFVHAAPWSVADQGHTNVSHGCINLSPANARWFYGFSHSEGDIVDIDNPVRGPSATDPGTEDWNMSWHAWRAGSALQHH